MRLIRIAGALALFSLVAFAFGVPLWPPVQDSEVLRPLVLVFLHIVPMGAWFAGEMMINIA